MTHIPKHSPFSWKASDRYICQNNDSGREDKHFNVIAQVKKWVDINESELKNNQSTEYGEKWLIDMSCPLRDGTEKASIEFIVRACNSYHEMLAALKNLENDNGETMPESAWDMVQAAIAKAEGK